MNTKECEAKLFTKKFYLAPKGYARNGGERMSGFTRTRLETPARRQHGVQVAECACPWTRPAVATVARVSWPSRDAPPVSLEFAPSRYVPLQPRRQLRTPRVHRDWRHRSGGAGASSAAAVPDGSRGLRCGCRGCRGCCHRVQRRAAFRLDVIVVAAASFATADSFRLRLWSRRVALAHQAGR